MLVFSGDVVFWRCTQEERVRACFSVLLIMFLNFSLLPANICTYDYTCAALIISPGTCKQCFGRKDVSCLKLVLRHMLLTKMHLPAGLRLASKGTLDRKAKLTWLDVLCLDVC